MPSIASSPFAASGGLAASAPLGYYAPSQWARRGVTPTTWFDTVVRDYTEAQPGCFVPWTVDQVKSSQVKPNQVKSS